MTSVELSTSARLDTQKKNRKVDILKHRKTRQQQKKNRHTQTLPVFKWSGVESAHILYFLWREKIIFKITKHQKSIDWWFTVKHTSTNAEVKLTNNTHTHAEVSAHGWWTTHLYVDVWEEKLNELHWSMVAGKHIVFRLNTRRIISYLTHSLSSLRIKLRKKAKSHQKWYKNSILISKNLNWVSNFFYVSLPETGSSV